MSKEISIYAAVSGNIKQDIVFNDDIEITPEEFVTGLSKGIYETTISHHAGSNAMDATGHGLVIQLNPFKIIGKVIYQESLDDLELSDFEASDN